MYVWIWAVLIVQGSLAVSGSLYMLFVQQKVIEVPAEPSAPQKAAEPSVPSKEPQPLPKSIRKKLLF